MSSAMLSLLVSHILTFLEHELLKQEYKSKKKQEIIENENINLPPKPTITHKVETE